MTRNKTIARPEPLAFELSDSMEAMYVSAGSSQIINSDTSIPDGDLVKGTMKTGEVLKGNDVLAIYNGNEWKYVSLYSSGKLIDFKATINKLEKRIKKLEHRSKGDRS